MDNSPGYDDAPETPKSIAFAAPIDQYEFVRPRDEIELEITGIAYGGAGLARHEGRVVFVRFTIPGEIVRAKVSNVRKSWAEADLMQIVRASPDRTSPPCPVFGKCGGCSYQHIAYPRQLVVKQRQVAETLRRIGKFSEIPVEATRPSPLEYAYRNRITVHVEPPGIGFRGIDARQLISIDECLLANDAVNARLGALRRKRHLRPGPATLRETDHAGSGFRQVNDAAADILAQVVGEMAGNGLVLIDAYCGAGFFARKLRGNFSRVIGIDWDARSIATARAEAADGEDFLEGDAAALLPSLLQQNTEAVLLLDPPAQGLSDEIVAAILANPPVRTIYISCDPSTLARDLAKMRHVFILRRVVPVDMFPQTASIEVAVLLERRTDIVSAEPSGSA